MDEKDKLLSDMRQELASKLGKVVVVL